MSTDNIQPKKKRRAIGIIALIFFLLTLLFSGYLLGLHYNLFPDYLAPYVDKLVPGADILPEKIELRSYELFYNPSMPMEYTELLLRRTTENGPEEYTAYAFTNKDGEVEYRGFARLTSVTYDKVTDSLSEGTTEHNRRLVERIVDPNTQEEIFVYSDSKETKIESGFVKLKLTEYGIETAKLYDYEIMEDAGFFDPESEELGTCEILAVAPGYEPGGANGIESVEGYTSLYRIPVSIYTDNSGAFTSYYVYYVYGGFDGGKIGFYPTDAGGRIIPGGLMNNTLRLVQTEDKEEP